MSDNWLLRTAEAYLNGAEAAAYLGDERTARELLEALRVKRWDREKYEPIQKTGEALVTEIHMNAVENCVWKDIAGSIAPLYGV